MADSTTPAPEADEAEEEGRTRLPRVVVRMSDAMKAALDAWLEKNEGVVATAMVRELLAEKIGWDLSTDADAPGSGTRTKYADDATRDAAKLRNRKRSSLLRKALFHVHQAQLKKRPALQEVAFAVVQGLSDDKIKVEAIDELDGQLDAAIKAGK